jgi:hypothetical protein
MVTPPATCISYQGLKGQRVASVMGSFVCVAKLLSSLRCTSTAVFCPLDGGGVPRSHDWSIEQNHWCSVDPEGYIEDIIGRHAMLCCGTIGCWCIGWVGGSASSVSASNP